MAGPTHALLTTASTLSCIHGGTVSLHSSQQKLTVDRHPVLLKTDLVGASIAGCANVGPNLTPCSSITSVITGASTALKVDRTAVITDAATGLTNAIPTAPVLWQVSAAGQTKLRA
jgi:hypothetical protein